MASYTELSVLLQERGDIICYLDGWYPLYGLFAHELEVVHELAQTIWFVYLVRLCHCLSCLCCQRGLRQLESC